MSSTDFLKNIPCPSRVTRNDAVGFSDPSLASYSIVSNVSSKKNPSTSTDFSISKKSKVPKYPHRKGWLPKKQDDFEDGGAYPEISILQYPSDMGAASSNKENIIPLQIGEDGKIQYDAVIKQNLSHRVAIPTRPDDVIPKWSASADLMKPSDEDIEEIEKKTKLALEQALASRLGRNTAKSAEQKPEYIRYTPSEQTPGYNPKCSQRIIHMVEAQVDPLEPPMFSHKRVPRGSGSPPPAILRSPPKKLSAKDQEAWKIPPCISNWKNQKGYTIPLDKRLQADGRSLQEVTINDKFACLSESLYIAERAAREEIRIRNELVKQKKEQEEILRENQLRELATKAKAEREAIMKQRELGTIESDGVIENSDSISKKKFIEKERRREIERDIRLERAGKKSKVARDLDRDISERIALGQAKPTAQEALFDSRLFNQSSGLDSGFQDGEDEKYNIYDKPLFADRSKDGGGIYRYDRERMEQNVGLLSSFGGTSATTSRSAPVEFEVDTDDPFGLNTLIDKAFKKKK